MVLYQTISLCTTRVDSICPTRVSFWAGRFGRQRSSVTGALGETLGHRERNHELSRRKRTAPSRSKGDGRWVDAGSNAANLLIYRLSKPHRTRSRKSVDVRWTLVGSDVERVRHVVHGRWSRDLRRKPVAAGQQIGQPLRNPLCDLVFDVGAADHESHVVDEGLQAIRFHGDLL